LLLLRPDGQRFLSPVQIARRLQQSEFQLSLEINRADQESRRAEQESQRAEQERQRADRMAERLRALGIDPDGDL
jgi:hypothetical protein